MAAGLTPLVIALSGFNGVSKAKYTSLKQENMAESTTPLVMTN